MLKRDSLGYLPGFSPDGKNRTGYVLLGSPGDFQTIPLLKFDINSIRIKDIARGLAKRCRFGASIDGWYSVAEHCVIGSYFFDDLHLQREFLIHDAAEYVFEDVVSPIVEILDDYRQLRDEFQSLINLRYLGKAENDPAIKLVDTLLCGLEQYNLRHLTILRDLPTDPRIKLDGFMGLYKWDYVEAERRFRERFSELFTIQEWKYA